MYFHLLIPFSAVAVWRNGRRASSRHRSATGLSAKFSSGVFVCSCGALPDWRVCESCRIPSVQTVRIRIFKKSSTTILEVSQSSPFAFVLRNTVSPIARCSCTLWTEIHISTFVPSYLLLFDVKRSYCDETSMLSYSSKSYLSI